MGGGGAPIGEARVKRKTFLENGTKVWREGEAEGGFDGGELGVGETVEDGDVGGLEVVDEGLGVGGKRKADKRFLCCWGGHSRRRLKRLKK